MLVAISKSKKKFVLVNSFQINVSYLFSLKMPERARFSDVFRMDKNGKLAWNELSNNSLESGLILIYNCAPEDSAIWHLAFLIYFNNL